MFKTSVSAVKPPPTDPENRISQIGKMFAFPFIQQIG